MAPRQTLTLNGQPVPNPHQLAEYYMSCQRETGADYYRYPASLLGESLGLADFALLVPMNAQPHGIAFRTFVDHLALIDASLTQVPTEISLHDDSCDDAVLDLLADLIEVTTSVGTSTHTSWIGVSIATKLLHKRRPALLPILDEQAIFQGYLGRSSAPEAGSKSRKAVLDALSKMRGDLQLDENQDGWIGLEQRWPMLTRIELFDLIWWEHDTLRRWSKRRPPGKAQKCLVDSDKTCKSACFLIKTTPE